MTNPTVKEVQEVIYVLRKFAEYDEYTLCRPYLKGLVQACAEVIDVVLQARDWKPVDENNEDI